MRPTFFILFGLVIGSFLSVVIHRVPQGEGLGGRSRCPRCGALIRPLDNIPVISWLFLRGRCRTCGNPISIKYPLIELATAALFLLADLTFEALALAIPAALFLATMLAIALIDARHK
ncbi:MAG: prepilin peptidase, partial [Actinomycetota bacterium]